ncbi:hypothetical protein [Nocardia tengchongensis]|uniref:hypothetical protein n=1 Tax=Nocardia tengchongensis TaxID=2055889 RepID=UPI0036205C9F
MVAGSAAIDRALADMRDGLRVLLVAPTNDAISKLLAEASEKLREGETIRKSAGGTITGSGGWIRFCLYLNPADGRGLTVDRVYVDHADLWKRLAPTMSGSTNGPVITHC